MKEWKELFEQEEKKEYYQKLMQFLDGSLTHIKFHKFTMAL